MWEVKYDNDTVPSDDSFSEWWTVEKDDISYSCKNESYAKKLAAVLNSIEKTSELDCKSDNQKFNPNIDSGGNFDDCYEIGVEDGEIQFGRSLKILFEVIE